ncbi:AIPR family protein [Pseudoxanthomonas sp.]|uniref:AIPR family protein n=1 Tax=Pseudoxanthomonas sp. TaxID=1871049 RepID=UPI00263492BB|nr:AIPR family protein [Pseudoxanthomonas sp.]WDS34766.1 MAG: AIPR family protein [Pseudoxanthomonas sp.]
MALHRIVKAHLESFVQSFGLEADDEAKQFEKFAAHCVVSNRYTGAFDLDDIVTDSDDDGIDAVSIMIDEVVTASREEAQANFATPRRNHDVELVFVQAKRSEGFDLGDFLKFKEGVLRFINQTPYQARNDVLVEARTIFDLVVNEVPKLRNGRPSLVARYVTTGTYQQPDALEAALRDFKLQVEAFGLFHDVDISFVGRDELTRLWVSTYSGIEASLPVFSIAALPDIAGIDEAYLAVVRASDFVNNLLVTQEGNLRAQVFEENVRSFLGEENQVNASIASTLASEAASRFPVLNNGITLVCPEVKLQGATLHLSNYQIVNGCQTSNVLFHHKNELGDVMVNIKVVKTQLEDVFADLVRATNSQTKVEGTQFLSLRPIIKRVEYYFNTYEGSESRLYLERRDRQYVGLDIPAVRIFSLNSAAKCVAAMWCNKPELAARYPKQLYEELTDIIFDDATKEAVFYAACVTMYRFNLLVSNSVIPQNMKRFKWHMLALVRAIVVGRGTVHLNSKSAEQSAQKIIAVMGQHGAPATDVFNQIVEICQGLGEVTPDRLKRQAILTDMLAAI